MKRILLSLFILISAQSIQAMEFFTCFHNACLELSLFRAAVKGDMPKTKELLELGVNPNSATFRGATALGWAAHHNHKEIVNLLIKAGAEVDVLDRGKTGPHFCRTFVLRQIKR